MTPAESKGELRQRLDASLDRVTARAGVDTMLAFYANERAEGVIEEDEGDMLLLQWGTYTFGGPPTFRVNVTRQFILPDEDEPYQLSLTFHHAPDGGVGSIASGNRWCHSVADVAAFRTFVDQLPALSATDHLQASRVELTYSQT